VRELPDPEDLAEDGCILYKRLFLEWERVEACRDDPLDRVGQRELRAVFSLGEHTGVLLGVEGIAAGSREECRVGLPDELLEKVGRVVI
jgi:hypothetical protein